LSEIIGNGRDRLFSGEEFVRGFELSGLRLANGFAADGSGGAVSFADGCGDLVVVDTLFVDNGALDKGGALHVQGGGTSSSSVRVERTRFDSNDCGTNGGAVAASDGVALRLSNVTFSNNSAVSYGAGLYVEYDVSLGTHGVDYYDNSAGSGGGGMACLYDSDVRIRGGVARGNEAGGSQEGGGGAYYFAYGTTIEMDGVLAEDNFAAYTGGAVMILFDCTATLRNVTALRNMVQVGGGGVMFYNGPSLRITESRISHGIAGGIGGGGIFVFAAEQLVIEVSEMSRNVSE
jgi:predicted outer membrane repeat protein